MQSYSLFTFIEHSRYIHSKEMNTSTKFACFLPCPLTSPARRNLINSRCPHVTVSRHICTEPPPHFSSPQFPKNRRTHNSTKNSTGTSSTRKQDTRNSFRICRCGNDVEFRQDGTFCVIKFGTGRFGDIFYAGHNMNIQAAEGSNDRSR